MGAQGWANSCPETFHEEGQKRRIPGQSNLYRGLYGIIIAFINKQSSIHLI